ncbi:hypothetical protein LJB84_01330 [Bacteroidales bacterium OttesenSCG-928-J19]|nr:hypothetical protein [Bacteroidales bacterium OttesenSCG-928-J19]
MIISIQGYTRLIPVFFLMSFFLLNTSGTYANFYIYELPRNDIESPYSSMRSSYFAPSEQFFFSYKNSHFAPSEQFLVSGERSYLKSIFNLPGLRSDTPSSEGGYIGEGDSDDPNGNGGMIAEATPIADGIEVLILLLFAYTVFLLIRKRSKASTLRPTQV